MNVGRRLLYDRIDWLFVDLVDFWQCKRSYQAEDEKSESVEDGSDAVDKVEANKRLWEVVK